MKPKDIYWYQIINSTDYRTNYIIGERGGTEYRVELAELMRQNMDWRIKTPEEMLRWAIEQSQVVDFIEVIENQKLLE